MKDNRLERDDIICVIHDVIIEGWIERKAKFVYEMGRDHDFDLVPILKRIDIIEEQA